MRLSLLSPLRLSLRHDPMVSNSVAVSVSVGTITSSLVFRRPSAAITFTLVRRYLDHHNLLPAPDFALISRSSPQSWHAQSWHALASRDLHRVNLGEEWLLAT